MAAFTHAAGGVAKVDAARRKRNEVAAALRNKERAVARRRASLTLAEQSPTALAAALAAGSASPAARRPSVLRSHSHSSHVSGTEAAGPEIDMDEGTLDRMARHDKRQREKYAARMNRVAPEEGEEQGHDPSCSRRRVWWVLTEATIPGQITPKLAWDAWVCVIILYSVIVVPYRIGFSDDAKGAMAVLDYCVDALFFCDIAINFVAQVNDEDGLVVRKRSLVAGRYLRGWFTIDLLSTIPVDLFVSWFGDSTAAKSFKLLRVLRLARLLKLVRLIKLGRLLDNMEELQDMLTLNPALVRLMKLLLQIVFLGHLLSCFWFWVASLEPAVGSFACDSHLWAGCPDVLDWPEGPASTWTQYVTSMYWTIATITTVGYGDVNAGTTYERLYAMVAMLVGASVFGFIIGNISSLLGSMDARQAAYKHKMDEVKEYLRDRRFPVPLAKRVRKYFEYYMDRRSIFDENVILSELSNNLRSQVVMQSNHDTISRIHFLREQDKGFVTAVMQRIKPMFVVAGERIMMEGDVGKEMYFLLRGTVEISCNLRENVKHDDTIGLFTEGHYFGEDALLSGNVRPYNATAVGHCDTFSLAKEDLEMSIFHFPDSRRVLEEAAKEKNVVLAYAKLSIKAALERYDAAMILKASTNALFSTSRRGSAGSKTLRGLFGKAGASKLAGADGDVSSGSFKVAVGEAGGTTKGGSAGPGSTALRVAVAQGSHSAGVDGGLGSGGGDGLTPGGSDGEDTKEESKADVSRLAGLGGAASPGTPKTEVESIRSVDSPGPGDSKEAPGASARTMDMAALESALPGTPMSGGGDGSGDGSGDVTDDSDDTDDSDAPPKHSQMRKVGRELDVAMSKRLLGGLGESRTDVLLTGADAKNKTSTLSRQRSSGGSSSPGKAVMSHLRSARGSSMRLGAKGASVGASAGASRGGVAFGAPSFRPNRTKLPPVERGGGEFSALLMGSVRAAAKKPPLTVLKEFGSDDQRSRSAAKLDAEAMREAAEHKRALEVHPTLLTDVFIFINSDLKLVHKVPEEWMQPQTVQLFAAVLNPEGGARGFDAAAQLAAQRGGPRKLQPLGPADKFSVLVKIKATMGWKAQQLKEAGRLRRGESSTSEASGKAEKEGSPSVFVHRRGVVAGERRDITAQVKPWHVIDPRTRGKLMWDILLAVLILYSVLLIPFRIGYDVEAEGVTLAFDYVVDVFFFIDMVVNFRTAFKEGYEDKWHYASRDIAVHYLKHWFTVDLLSTVPIDSIVEYFADDSKGTTFRSFKLVRVLRLIRLLKLARLAKLNKFVAMLEDQFHVSPAALRLIKLFFEVMFIAHLMCCGFFFASTIDSTNVNTWWRQQGFNPKENLFEVYVASIYFSYSTMTTVGYGDVYAVNNSEMIYTIICMIAGATVFGYIVGSMASIVNRLNYGDSRYKDKMDEVAEYLRERNITPDLRKKIRRYYEYYLSRKSAFDEATILSELSDSLKREAILHLNKDIIRKIPFFEAQSEGFISFVMSIMSPMFCVPRDYIFQQGEIGLEMYFLVKGRVEVVQGTGEEEAVLKELEEGSFFGEIAILCATKRTASIRAITFCNLFVLMKDDLDMMILHYPTLAAMMQQSIRKKMETMWAESAAKQKFKRHARLLGLAGASSKVQGLAGVTGLAAAHVAQGGSLSPTQGADGASPSHLHEATSPPDGHLHALEGGLSYFEGNEEMRNRASRQAAQKKRGEGIARLSRGVADVATPPTKASKDRATRDDGSDDGSDEGGSGFVKDAAAL
eukprot:CAMPEP_0203810142 /NCGR_PEP_ID=MMETSP0115-20131106/2759_1 /ASSEMBLY_ACC=CAM_ASM_000227 /TAXON_ID=33651 /ORGANISM="Bicosoecid sp, Strain ms1" /LENGTH=1752 /DNA_ID=CAMNT_0050718925 /DNA_START=358 /DNA_END=5612 /DNA_ORIENTATION=-